MRPIWYRSIHEIRELMFSGKITSVELTRMYLDRIAALDGKDGLNTIAELDPSALEQAAAADRNGLKGLLAGIPFLIKDNIDAAGLHTTAGSQALKDHIAKEDAPAVAALRRAGAVILGKTNMTEFANFTTRGMPGGYSSHGGQVLHAYDRGRNPSGSSSGSAVAVSAGLCAAALGTDTSFSVVGCATEHGICGFKPVVGIISQQGIVPISHTQDSVGILARDMKDVMTVYDALRDAPLPDIKPLPPQSLKLAVNMANRDMVSKAQMLRYHRLIKRMKAEGVTVSEVTQMPTPAQIRVMTWEFGPGLEKYLASAGDAPRTLHQIVDFYRADEGRMKYGISLLEDALQAMENPDHSDYEKAMEERERLYTAVRDELKPFDACMVTGPTNVCHFVGMPSVSVPFCMAADGCPRSVILYGADEKRLFSAALTMETFSGKIRPPKL